MKIWLGALLLLVTTVYGLDAGTEVQRLAITAQGATSVKEDLGRSNPKWQFVAGQWVRRASGGRAGAEDSGVSQRRLAAEP